MVFERLYCTFSWVLSVIIRWNELEGDGVVSEVGFEGCGAFIIHNVEVEW